MDSPNNNKQETVAVIQRIVVFDRKKGAYFYRTLYPDYTTKDFLKEYNKYAGLQYGSIEEIVSSSVEGNIEVEITTVLRRNNPEKYTHVDHSMCVMSWAERRKEKEDKTKRLERLV